MGRLLFFSGKSEDTFNLIHDTLNEALGRIDELEGGKAKLGSRVNEAEETIDSLNTKIAATEKSKHRLEAELEELAEESQ